MYHPPPPLKCFQSPRKEVNAAMKKEAEYFGDIVILPFLDRYDLVVLKTFAICEYGVSSNFLSFMYVTVHAQ